MTKSTSLAERIRRRLLVLPFLALLVVPVGTAAAAFQDAPGSYEGMVNGADGFPIVTLLSGGADGKISGTYEIDENGNFINEFDNPVVLARFIDIKQTVAINVLEYPTRYCPQFGVSEIHVRQDITQGAERQREPVGFAVIPNPMTSVR